MSWDARYPSRDLLKGEVEAMQQAIVEALLEAIPRAEIDSIYLKGSAVKEWDSPLDYVPELSDVDLHLLFKDDAGVPRHLGTMDQALAIQARIEASYLARVPQPVHVPRPQLTIANLLLKDEDYVPSPRSTVRVVYGKEHPRLGASGWEAIRQADCKHLLEMVGLLDRLPLRVIDKPCRYLWGALRTMSWMVSPVGPQVLSLLGVAYERAWGANRTHIVACLRELGQQDLADDYSRFYLRGWDCFLSGWLDGDAGRSCLAAGACAIGRGIQVARDWIEPPPAG